MLENSFERLPGEIEPIVLGIAILQPGHDPHGLDIVVKAAIGGHELVKLALARMAKRRVTEVVGQGQGFGQILIKAKDAGDGPCHLGYFNRMG